MGISVLEFWVLKIQVMGKVWVPMGKPILILIYVWVFSDYSYLQNTPRGYNPYIPEKFTQKNIYPIICVWERDVWVYVSQFLYIYYYKARNSENLPNYVLSALFIV